MIQRYLRACSNFEGMVMDGILVVLIFWGGGIVGTTR